MKDVAAQLYLDVFKVAFRGTAIVPLTSTRRVDLHPFLERAIVSICVMQLVPFMYLPVQAGIGLGMSIGRVSGKTDTDYGTVWGYAGPNTAQSTWNVLVAFGSIAFAYSYSLILIEIEDSLAQPPSEAQSMKKATTCAVGITVNSLAPSFPCQH